MCFSATGSFAVSGVLAGLGAAALVRNQSKLHRMFAAIPLLFAAQQAAEGIVWLTLTPAQPGTLQRLAVTLFLGFALVVWPSWLPWSLRLIERDPVRRRRLGLLFGCGVLVSLCAAFLLAYAQPSPSIAGHSVAYAYHWADSPLHQLYLLGYAIPTVIPFFVSTARLARTIGAMLVVSLVVAALVQRDALTSVWCFFAAILSGVILVSVAQEQKFTSPLVAATATGSGVGS